MRGPHRRSLRRSLGALLVICAALAATSPDALAQCDPTTDCNNNGVLDSCDITLGTSDDCNLNGIPDSCDIAGGTSVDCNFNQIPDECEPAPSFTLSPAGGLASVDAVSMRGNVAVVGAVSDGTLGTDAGAVHVFRRVGTVWTEEGAPLRASDGTAGDQFGASVALDGNFLAVGAPGAESGALTDVGAVYIFRRNPTIGWVQSAKLTLLPPLDLEGLGTSVSIRGNRVIAGAPQTAAGGTGRAVIYSFNGLSWAIDAVLSPPSLAAGDNFGVSVSMGVTQAFVGAWGHAGGGTPLAGAVFAYELAGVWSLESTLTAPIPETAALFGITVAGDDSTLAVGSPNQGGGSGAVHLYTQDSGTWAHVDEFLPEPTSPGRQFGEQVSLSRPGTRILIAELEDTGTGRVTVERRTNGVWGLESTTDVGVLGDGAVAGVSGDGVYALVRSATIDEAEILWIAPPADCNGNGIDDSCDIAQGVSSDCNLNGIPDSCDLVAGTSADCDGNLIPDDCQLDAAPQLDCNLNGTLDSCDLAGGASLDCNGNGIPDECDIASGLETDCLGDGIPDSCQGLTDTTAPVISGLQPVINASPDPGFCGATVTWDAPTVTDDCAVGNVSSSHSSGALFPVGTTTVTITATDTAGNSANASFSIVVTDDIGPVISDLPADFSVPTTGGLCSAVVSWTPPTASDGCGLISLTSNIPNNSTRPAGATVVTYTATDVHGNVSTASFTVTVVDSIAPTYFAIPGDQTLSVDAATCGAVATWTPPVLTDNCPAPSSVASHAPGSTFPVGDTVVTYTGTDGSGNETTASFTITVVDDVAPILSGVPLDQVVTIAPGSCSAQLNWTAPTATDPCGLLSLTSNLGPGVTVPAGVYPITYIATDTTGNTVSATFTATVLDLEDPLISGMPADITMTLGPASCLQQVNWTAPTASDNCTVASLVPSHAPGSNFPSGTTTVTYTATDNSGNPTTASFDVTILDGEVPTIPDLPTSFTVATDSGACEATVSWIVPAGADNCAVANVLTTHQPGTIFPLGDTVVNVTVTDTAGNSTSGSFTVTVADQEAPTISGVTETITVDADPGGCTTAVSWPLPTAVDNCSVASSTASHTSGDLFSAGTTVVTFTATDAAGNTTTATTSITVVDATPPTVGPIPANLVLPTDPGACTTVVNYLPPTVGDDCGIADFTSSHPPGTAFPIGTTTISFLATDLSGNETATSFTITIEDLGAPSLTVGADLTVPADAGICTADVTVPLPSASDTCSGVTLTNDFNGSADASGTYPLGTTTVTWTATDASGNETTTAQLVTVDLPPGADCNGNGIPDSCDLITGTSLDCNENGIPDECDLTAGTSVDLDGNGVPDECDVRFVRGDSNDDGTMNIADAIFTLQNLFTGGPLPGCLDAADNNDDGFLDISDVIYGITYIFGNGAPPPAPFPACGTDENGTDSLDCLSTDHCP